MVINRNWFIPLLIIFLIGFPMIGIYEANKISQAHEYPVMDAWLARTAWMARGFFGACMLIVMKYLRKLRMSNGAKKFAVITAGVVNIGFMILPPIVYMGSQYVVAIWIVANLLTLLSIEIDRKITEEMSKEEE